MEDFAGSIFIGLIVFACTFLGVSLSFDKEHDNQQKMIQKHIDFVENNNPYK